MRSVRLGLFLLLALSGCGDTKVPSAPGNRQPDAGDDPYSRDASISGNGGNGGRAAAGTGGKSGSGGTNMDMADAGPDPLAPTVSFIAPTPTNDANSEDVITVTSLSVRCKVEASTETGAGKVDKSAVKIAIQNIDDENAFVDGAVSAITDTEFEATFEVSARPNGKLKLQCRAKDLLGHAATKVMTTLLDMGPKITLKKPLDKQRYALKTPMPIEFDVAPDPVAQDDGAAQVKSVVLNVGGANFPISESKDTPGLYQTSIDFSDKVKFPVTPESAQLQISATNARAPKPATRIVRAAVAVDGSGPRIDIASPANVSIQRGVVPLSVSVTDPAGLMPGTLIATINTQRYDNWEGMAPNFVLSFDTNQLDPKHELTQLTINVTAIDGVGNKTNPPVSLILRLDNLPPVISLDPPSIVESRIGSDGKTTVCSQPFDPVGASAASDKETVPSAKIFRALVEDRTNHTADSFRWYADVDKGAVELYMQALSYPLLVDTNGDGICDAINKSDDMNIRDSQRVSPDNDPQKIKLDPITPIGTSWFAKESIAPITTAGCPNDPFGAESAPPKTCPSSEMGRIVAGRNQDKPPAVYALVPSNDATKGACNGDFWNIKGVAHGAEGWICFAARAADTIGNVGISEPLRLCFDDGEGPPPDCSGEPPSCRGKNDKGVECTISAAQKFDPEIWPVPP